MYRVRPMAAALPTGSEIPNVALSGLDLIWMSAGGRQKRACLHGEGARLAARRVTSGPLAQATAQGSSLLRDVFPTLS